MKRMLSQLRDGRLLDVFPMAEGARAIVLNAEGWRVFEGTTNQMLESKPLSKIEINELIGAGRLSSGDEYQHPFSN